MKHFVAFHLGLHCLPKYPFRSFQYEKSYQYYLIDPEIKKGSFLFQNNSNI